MTQRAWTDRDGRTTTTRVADGACIFLNDPGFPGGPGCALHVHAVPRMDPHEAGRRVLAAADPAQLSDHHPSRRRHLGSRSRYDRRLGSGGHDLDWYCTGSPGAARRPGSRSIAAHVELTEIMGPPAYAARPACGATSSRSRRCTCRGARTLLPLLAHPSWARATRRRRRWSPAAARLGGVRQPQHLGAPRDLQAREPRFRPPPGSRRRSARSTPYAEAHLLDIGFDGFHLPGSSLGRRVSSASRGRILRLPGSPLGGWLRGGGGGRPHRGGAGNATARSVDRHHYARWAYFFRPSCERPAEVARAATGRSRRDRRQHATTSTFGGWFRAVPPGIRSRWNLLASRRL